MGFGRDLVTRSWRRRSLLLSGGSQAPRRLGVDWWAEGARGRGGRRRGLFPRDGEPQTNNQAAWTGRRGDGRRQTADGRTQAGLQINAWLATFRPVNNERQKQSGGGNSRSWQLAVGSWQEEEVEAGAEGARKYGFKLGNAGLSSVWPRFCAAQVQCTCMGMGMGHGHGRSKGRVACSLTSAHRPWCLNWVGIA